MKQNIKKLFLSFALIITFSAYVIFQRAGAGSLGGRVVTPNVPADTGTPNTTDNTRPQPSNTDDNGQTQPAATNNTPTPAAPSPTPAPVKTDKYGYKDGTYIGDVADAYYGSVQVQATIKNGRIIDVRFLDYPHDRSTSREINSQAMPYLKLEAIQAQNANVDGVSGATQTSGAFVESLGSALAQAKP